LGASIAIAILTVSDTRTIHDDKSGAKLAELIVRDGHQVIERQIIPDDQHLIQETLLKWLSSKRIDVIIATGGTGLTGRDVTPEAFRAVYEKEIDGFGEMFRWLSYQKIGTSALQSRATGGVAQGKYLFALPGSPSACQDAWEFILKHQLNDQCRPCNLVQLMPRLQEDKLRPSPKK